MGLIEHQPSVRVPLCERCRLRVDLCVCADIPTIEIQTRLVLLIHSLEQKKASNTARFLNYALPTSEIRLNGTLGAPLDLSGLAEKDRELLILFPNPGKPPLDSEFVKTLKHPVTLLVPDGTWQQAKKIAAHASMLPNARRISVPRFEKSKYRLRLSDRAERLCTLEAVAAALGILERPEVETELLALLDKLVVRSMLMRKRGAAR